MMRKVLPNEATPRDHVLRGNRLILLYIGFIATVGVVLQVIQGW